MDNIVEKLKPYGEKVGFYYKDILTGHEFAYNADKAFVAASVIKIPVFLATLLQIQEGKFHGDDLVTIKEEDKMPSCGSLTYMHSGLSVTVQDLYTLMIILSDNTATNILIKKTGMENINRTLEKLGLTETKVNRLLFDADARKQGRSNYVTARETGFLLEGIYNKTLGSKEISTEMERVLKLQRMNGKIPYLIEEAVEIAHKTGEDTRTTHDVGIVYTKRPFVVCFLSNNVNVIQFERTIQELSLELYLRSGQQ